MMATTLKYGDIKPVYKNYLAQVSLGQFAQLHSVW